MAAILVIRLRFLGLERRRQRFLAVWRPLFTQALYQLPANAPHVRGGERFLFLLLFNHFHSLVKGEEEKERLNAFAVQEGLPPFAMATVHRGNLPMRIAAAQALGFLKETSAFEALEALARVESTALSLAAASAVTHVNPPRAMRELMPMLTARPDWPPSACERMLLDAGQAAASGPLKEAVMAAGEDTAPTLLRYLHTAAEETAAECARFWLTRARSPETLSAALQSLKDPRLRPMAREYLAHPVWHVRTQAVKALGRIGDQGDAPYLIRALTDKEWWVRYRAARTLAEAPFVDHAAFTAIREAQTDRYAREALDRAAAETGK
ncbi:MAG: HEAT repeat domain-containing protein [Nitrospinae bacterium]|nr:HEAT repeat domain-containing protein [Nitrospinota bacterium]